MFAPIVQTAAPGAGTEPHKVGPVAIDGAATAAT